MLKIKNLSVETTSGKAILDKVNISIKPKELHLILGPNGAGKSTLGKAIINWPEFKVSGFISINDEDISHLEMHERARKGIFYAHQSPVEIEGVNFIDFLRNIYNQTKPENSKLDPWSFKDLFDAIVDKLEFPSDFNERSLNAGLSGGEKRKSELLQMLILEPKYAILDEIDSGVDIDSTKLIFEILKEYQVETETGIIIISHNPKILDYITPDFVHVIKDGKLSESGDIKVAKKILKDGYAK